MISIIMPAYNVEKYISESIQSVLNQTYDNWELIIVNDGSKDGTKSVAESFTDARIKIINQANAGVSNARNAGILAANGEYIALLDADDLWLPEFLELMTKEQERSKATFIYCGYYSFFENGEEKHYERIYAKDNVIIRKMDNTLACHISSILVKRKLLLEHNLFFTPGCAYFEDLEFIQKVCCFASVSFVPRELLKYRQRAGAASNLASGADKALQNIIQANRTKEFIENNYSVEDKDIVMEQYNSNLNHMYYRTALRCIREKKYDKAEEILDSHQFFTDSKWQLKDLIRLPLVKSCNKSLWRFL